MRTWSFVITAVILYIPANFYPVMTVIQLGSGEPGTIMGGVEELVQTREFRWRSGLLRQHPGAGAEARRAHVC